MAVDMFLDIDGVKGEAQDKTHKDQIDILAWSWGMSNSGSAHVGGGAGSGKVNVQDISVTKYIDKSTPILMKSACEGSHFAKATLTVRKAGGTPLEYIIIDMTEVYVTALSSGGSGGEDRLTENATLNFRTFKYKYVEQTKEGSEGDKPEFGWNIAENTEQ